MSFKVIGEKKLQGNVVISGAKNAVLPILVGSLLTDSEIILKNVPNILDVHSMCQLLNLIGCKIFVKNNLIHLYPSPLTAEIVSPATQSIRVSISLLGPLLSKFGYVRMSLPGGCKIGTRKIDYHLMALRALGATISIDMENEIIEAEAEKLRGTEITLEFPSVGTTEHIMVTSCMIRGKTIIQNAAKEPEIVDLANFLNSMGAKIKGAGTNLIRIDGVNELNGTEYTIIPDRIEAGTYGVVAAITKGNVIIENVIPKHLEAIIKKLREMGSKIEVLENSIRVLSKGHCKAANISTAVYPGFPTDMQPVITSLLTLAEGTGIIKENIYGPDRFFHVMELQKIGANVEVNGNVAIVKGVQRLKGARVTAHDIRSGAALVLATLAAEGESLVTGVHQIDRAYEKMEWKLKNIGAEIQRITR